MYTYKDNLVSLITPGWNGKQFVHRLLDSILEQTYRPIEYIYVDDGSTDGTVDVVLSYKEKFEKANIDFKFIQRENGGICEALMTGFQHVTGEYMSCPEYDDILSPNSVEKKVKYLKEHPDCAVVVAEAWVVNENNLHIKNKYISNNNPNRFDRNHFYQSLMSNTIFNAACYMVKMYYFDQTHPNREIINYKFGSNQQILLPLYYHYNRGFIEEPLSYYVIRNNSLSQPTFKSYEEHIKRLETYENMLYETIDTIGMSIEDKKLYKKRVKINVQKDIIDLAFIYKKNDIFNITYYFLKNENEITDKHRTQFSLINNTIKYILYKTKLYIQNLI